MIKRHQRPGPPETNGHKNGRTISARHEHAKPGSGEAQKPKSPIAEWFRLFAHKASEIVGSPWTFLCALTAIIGWAAVGPLCEFSDTWQLVINTATTIVTFLMVFLIQNTQNRDAKAMHLKLDELIHAIKGARDKLIDVEDLSDEEVAKLQEQFKRVGKNRHSARNESRAPEKKQG